MATTPASGGDLSIEVDPTAHAADAASDEEARHERESRADMAMRKLERLNTIVFYVAFFELAGNVVGTLASLWATVVLLGGFCSLLNSMDFWFSAIMIFIEGSRVFIRKDDASVNQRLFSPMSTFASVIISDLSRIRIEILMIIGVSISLTPVEFRPEIGAGILKVAFLVIIISWLLTRMSRGWFVNIVIVLFIAAAVCGGIVGAFKLGLHSIKRFKVNRIVSYLLISGLLAAWQLGTMLLIRLAIPILSRMPFLRRAIPLLCFKVIIAFGLACLPFLQAALASYYRYVSISVAVLLLRLSFHRDYWREVTRWEHEKNRSCRLLLHILETILPILFCWSVMFPLPGISLNLSFYMLFSVIATVLMGNFLIPVAFLQVLLSVLRLRSLLGRHHDYRPLPPDASPNFLPSIVVFFVMELCQGSLHILATIPGLISLFYRLSLVRDLGFKQKWGAKALNLYQRQAYQEHTEKGLFPSESISPNFTSFAIESLGSTSNEMQVVGLRVLESFLERWHPKSRKNLIEEIIFTSKKAVPNLIDMLRSTDKDIRLLAARIINMLAGSIKVSEYPAMVKLISSLLDVKNRQDFLPPNNNLKISEFPCMIKPLLDVENQQDSLPSRVSETNGGNVESRRQSICTTDESFLLGRMSFPSLGMSMLQSLASDPDNCTQMVTDATYIATKTIRLMSYLTDEENCGYPQQKEMLRSCLNVVRWLARNSGKIGPRFCQELLDSSFLLNSLGRILDAECQPELWEPVMDIIAALAMDEAVSQEIGSTQSIVRKLMHAFLMPADDVNPSENNGRSLQIAAGEALANITIKSIDNLWAVLLVEQGHNNLMEKLIGMLDDECCICVAANLLHNLCANSRDKLMDIDLGANTHLESALRKVMQIIMTTKEGKKLEAALCVTSQIGNVIPKCFRKVLVSEIDAAALVKKLVDTLNSNREPCPEYPRIRRVLVEAVISIVRLCPDPYRAIFREKRVKDALDMVKGTPSRLEKYRVFVNGKGVLPESLPMRSLVDKAKRLIHRPTPSLQLQL